MIINKNIRTFTIYSLIIICVCTFSCELDKTDNENFIYSSNLYENAENKAINIRIKTNIEEAKALSDLSVLNETIIMLSSLILEKKSLYPVNSVSQKLKKDHIKIKKNLNEIAKKNLIFLPASLSKNEINEISKIEETNFPKAYFDKIIEVLEDEIEQTEYLSLITNDIDFKVLTVKTLVKLNYNLVQTNKTLNQINY